MIRASGRDGGFSLVEGTIALALLVVLLGALVFNFVDLGRGSRLDEGAGRVETLLRFARAEAARTGRRMRVMLAAESTAEGAAEGALDRVRVERETDPLGRPGEFDDVSGAAWAARGLGDLVEVVSVTPLRQLVAGEGENEPAAMGPSSREAWKDGGPRQDAATVAPVTFHPDGSADAVQIVIAEAGAREPEPRTIGIRVHGITGALSRFDPDRARDDTGNRRERTRHDRRGRSR